MNVTQEELRDYVRKEIQGWPAWKREAAIQELMPKPAQQVVKAPGLSSIPLGVQWIYKEGYKDGRVSMRPGNNGHVLYENCDDDAPSSIKDGNGDIVLGLCRICGAGEIELEQQCPPLSMMKPVEQYDKKRFGGVMVLLYRRINEKNGEWALGWWSQMEQCWCQRKPDGRYGGEFEPTHYMDLPKYVRSCQRGSRVAYMD